jgi:hypothetical protein
VAAPAWDGPGQALPSRAVLELELVVAAPTRFEGGGCHVVFAYVSLQLRGSGGSGGGGGGEQ